MANGKRGDKQGADDSALRLAVLIDADNAQAAVIDGLLAEIARFGEATVKRIYGDFSSPHSKKWAQELNRHAIMPIHQIAYTTGKNATDGKMIIDAMDLLYTRRFDGFCLVSSDSDFTGLALRIREEGLRVYGFGEKKTPEAFRNACHRFLFTEVLRPVSDKPVKPSAGKSASKAAPAEEPSARDFPRALALDALDKASDDSDAGWVGLGEFGSILNKLQPEFDARLYGCRKLSDLVRARPDIFECEERVVSDSGSKALYVRAK